MVVVVATTGGGVSGGGGGDDGGRYRDDIGTIEVGVDAQHVTRTAVVLVLVVV